MKVITANKLNRLWKNGFLPKLGLKIDKTKVLTTIEQVSANTNAENITGANVAKELINKLNGCSLEQDGEDFYVVGADSVRKKLGSASVVYKNIVDNVNTVTTSEYACTESGDYYIFAFAISGGAANASHVSYDFSCGGEAISIQNLGRDKASSTYVNHSYFYHYKCNKNDKIRLVHKAYDSNATYKSGTSGLIIVH